MLFSKRSLPLEVKDRVHRVASQFEDLITELDAAALQATEERAGIRDQIEYLNAHHDELEKIEAKAARVRVNLAALLS